MKRAVEQRGRVFLVGAGPGDPELVTRKAERLIRSCDALVYDYLISKDLLTWVRPQCRCHCVGKRAGFHSLPQEEIQALLVALAGEGLQVVRLKGGDPFVFGRGGEEVEALAREGVACEVVPAVTAALGCAAALQVPLTHRDHAAAVTFLSGHEQPGKPFEQGIDWAHHARSGATLVLYMAVGHLPEITAALIAGGKDPGTPGLLVEWGTMPQQREVFAPLGALAETVAAAGLGAPAVVIIGDVAGTQLRHTAQVPMP